MSSGVAKGKVIWNSATNWQGTFTVNGVKVTYSASIDKALPKFNVNVASVSYGDIDNNFTGTVNWHGTIGQDSVNIKLDNGVLITGDLQDPISDANTVNGAGSWTSKGEEGTRSLSSPVQAAVDLIGLQIDRANRLLLQKNGRRVVGLGPPSGLRSDLVRKAEGFQSFIRDIVNQTPVSVCV